MGVLKYYAAVNNYHVIVQTAPPITPKTKTIPSKIYSAKPITLANYSGNTANFVGAYKLSDYRHKHFNLTMLPKVEIALDKLLAINKGGWNV